MVRSKFEDELMFGMQRELHSEAKKQGMNNLVKAAEYLHSALDILEENGMQAQAGKVLAILEKLAHKDTRVKEMPSVQKLLEHGVKMSDFKNLEGDAFARARVNTAFRRLGFTDKEIASFIGKHNVMSEEDAAEISDPKSRYQEFMNWTKNPYEPIGPEDIQNKSPEISMKSQLGGIPRAEDIVFASIAQELGLDENDAKGKPHKPKNQTKVPNGHTHGLTSEKMVKNVENHGTVFNMADDGAADDLLNVEIGEDPLEVSEPNPEKTFE